MALAFNKIKSSKLGPKDKLPSGRLIGCRVMDVWDTDYEYLIWADKAGLFKYTAEVISHLHERGNFVKIKEYYDNEVQPWLDDDLVDDSTVERVTYADGSGYVNYGGPCGPLYFDRNGDT